MMVRRSVALLVVTMCAATAGTTTAGCRSTHGHPLSPPIEILDGDDYLNQLLQPAGISARASTATVAQLQAQRDDQVNLLSTYRLDYGDRFSIGVLESPDRSARVQVMPDGNIYFGFVTPVHVLGKTIEEAREAIVEALRIELQDPYVKVEEIELAPTSNTVKVVGALNEPGRVRIQPGSKLQDAIADAGGVRVFVDRLANPYAQNTTRVPQIDWRRATVQREAQYLPRGTRPSGVRDTDLCLLNVNFIELIAGNSDHNIPLYPNDVITIPQYEPINERVLVAGKVRSPGVQYYLDTITVAEALVRAGWIIEEEGAFHGVYLVRNSMERDGPTEVYRLSALNIVRGRARDIPLRDRDILYVDSDSLHDANVFVSKVVPLFNATTTPLNTYERYRDFSFR